MPQDGRAMGFGNEAESALERAPNNIAACKSKRGFEKVNVGLMT